MNSYKQSLYSGLVRICANLLMIGAIFLAMFQASRTPAWPSEAVFCLVFFGAVIPVWICAWLLLKWLHKRFPAPKQSLVDLPRLGSQLVGWRLLNSHPVSPRKPTPRPTRTWSENCNP